MNELQSKLLKSVGGSLPKIKSELLPACFIYRDSKKQCPRVHIMFHVWVRELKLHLPKYGSCLFIIMRAVWRQLLWAPEAKVVFTLFLELSVLASLSCSANIVGAFEYSISPGREILQQGFDYLLCHKMFLFHSGCPFHLLFKQMYCPRLKCPF